MIDLSHIKLQEKNIDILVKELYNYDDEKFFWLGLQDYSPVFRLQKEIHKKILDNKIRETTLLLEHNNVYTLGKNANRNHILPLQTKCKNIVSVDRGGDVTYHGPGQLICYPLINLKNYKKSISWYIDLIQDSIIEFLDENNIFAEKRLSPHTGVWVEDEKIAAIGIRLSKWITSHGFSLNVNTDLSYYDGIIPCGIFDQGVTSVHKIRNDLFDLKNIAIFFERIISKKLNEVPSS